MCVLPQVQTRSSRQSVQLYGKFSASNHSVQVIDSLKDAAAAALFTACKIEDTLKKSRDIVCAAYNLKLPPSEQVSPDDAVSSLTSCSAPLSVINLRRYSTNTPEESSSSKD